MFSNQLLQDLSGQEILKVIAKLAKPLKGWIMSQMQYNKHDDDEFKKYRHMVPILFQSDFFDVESLYDLIFNLRKLIGDFAKQGPGPTPDVVKHLYNAWLAKVVLYQLRSLNMLEPEQVAHGTGSFIDKAEVAFAQIDPDSIFYPQACYDLGQQYSNLGEVTIDPDQARSRFLTALRFFILCLQRPNFVAEKGEDSFKLLLLELSQKCLSSAEFDELMGQGRFDDFKESLIDKISHLDIAAHPIPQPAPKAYDVVAADLTQMLPLALQTALQARTMAKAIKAFNDFTYTLEGYQQDRSYLTFYRLHETSREVQEARQHISLIRSALYGCVDQHTLTAALDFLCASHFAKTLTVFIRRDDAQLFETPVTTLDEFKAAFIRRNERILMLDMFNDDHQTKKLEFSEQFSLARVTHS